MGVEISEPQLAVPVLDVLSEEEDGFMTTSGLIKELATRLPPEGKDAEIAIGRSDTYFSQKVRNLVSHRHGRSSIFSRGLVQYDGRRRGLRITEAGMKYIRTRKGR